MSCEIQLVRDTVTILHLMGLLVAGELIHNGRLYGLLLFRYASYPLVNIGMFHLMLPKAENEVVR